MSSRTPAGLSALIDYLKRSRGFDFTGYKPASLERRIHKRMLAVGVREYPDYVDTWRYIRMSLRFFSPRVLVEQRTTPVRLAVFLSNCSRPASNQ